MKRIVARSDLVYVSVAAPLCRSVFQTRLENTCEISIIFQVSKFPSIQVFKFTSGSVVHFNKFVYICNMELFVFK